MAKFRKKPVVVEAVQFTGDNYFVCAHFMGLGGLAHIMELSCDSRPLIETLEGRMEASVGDWIIKGVKGEFYPCKPDIFAATYDAVEG